MDKATFTDRLSTALKAEVPSDVLRKTWIGRRADELNPPIDERRLATYLHGENECPGSILLNLFEKFGSAFEAKVRGTTQSPGDRKAELRVLLEQALETLDTRVVPIAGKIS
ncbi:hypothetical protein LCGC14_2065540 [marine sediment metagenome]|uniref:Uncharacterized protein n=1 Tax=marine sediment metagenome TaxID=412755 RepID=A0A0F9EK25_9ZZZZ